MKRSIIALAIGFATLSGCAMHAQPYQIQYQSQQSLAELKVEHYSVGVSGFNPPANFDSSCRLMGPMQAPEGDTFESYMKKAFVKELQTAKLYTDSNPKVSLSADILNMSFSSSDGITNGAWNFDILFKSSNGTSYRASDSYKFSTGFDAISACNNTANAFSPALGQLFAKTFGSLEFARLLR